MIHEGKRGIEGHSTQLTFTWDGGNHDNHCHFVRYLCICDSDGRCRGK